MEMKMIPVMKFKNESKNERFRDGERTLEFTKSIPKIRVQSFDSSNDCSSPYKITGNRKSMWVQLFQRHE